MCVITDEVIDSFGNYQRCSCGKHLWNSKTNTLNSCHKGDGGSYFFYVAKDGKRYKIPARTSLVPMEHGSGVQVCITLVWILVLMAWAALMTFIISKRI